MNLHILLNSLCKPTINIQESRKLIKYIKSYKQNNFLFCETCFLFAIHLNSKQLRFSVEPLTQPTGQSRANAHPTGT